MRLTMQRTSNDDCGAICKSITLIWDNGHAGCFSCYRDLALDSFWIGNMIACLLGTDSMRDRNLYNFGPNTCKGGRQELVYSGRIICHREQWGWQTSISGCLWLVGSRMYFREGYRDNHLMERSSVVLVWFPHITLYLFHLVAWWVEIFRVGYVMTWDWVLAVERKMNRCGMLGLLE